MSGVAVATYHRTGVSWINITKKNLSIIQLYRIYSAAALYSMCKIKQEKRKMHAGILFPSSPKESACIVMY